MDDLSGPIVGGNYHAFLVRLWRGSTEAQWRASVEDVVTGEVIVFSEMESLYLYLHQQTIEQGAAPHCLEPA